MTRGRRVHRWLGSRNDSEAVVHQRVTRYRDLVADDLQEGFVPFVERERIGALDREHADQSIAREERQRELCLRVRQSRQRYGDRKT